MRLRWWDRPRPRASRPAITPRRLELEITQKILAEVFCTLASDVEEMIRLRGEERRWHRQVDECF